jgi:hypothetical protein
LLSLLRREAARINGKAILITVTLHNVVLRENLARHVLRDLLVVFELAFISR